MNKFLFLIILSVIQLVSYAQKDSLCQAFKKDTLYNKVASFLNLHKGDTIADIGAEFGFTIVRVAHYCPDVIFYEEDINRFICNRLFFKNTIKKACSNASINQFRFFGGDPKHTNFKPHFFSKIFISLSVHEFEFKEAMIRDMKRILRSDGHLYIMETFFKIPAPKDKNCKYPFMLEPDFLQLMNNAGFVLIKQVHPLDAEESENTTCSLFEFILQGN